MPRLKISMPHDINQSHGMGASEVGQRYVVTALSLLSEAALEDPGTISQERMSGTLGASFGLKVGLMLGTISKNF